MVYKTYLMHNIMKRKATVLIFAGIAVPVALLGLIYFQPFRQDDDLLSTARTETDNVSNAVELKWATFYSESCDYSFQYPDGWVISDLSSESDDSEAAFKVTYVEIVSPDESFSFGFREISANENTPVADCAEYRDCGLEEERLAFEYNTDEFEVLTALDGAELFIAKTGLFYIDSTEDYPKAVTEGPELYGTGHLTQTYADNMLTTDMTIFGNTQSEESFRISYTFYSEKGVSYWDEYKEILRTFVSSITRV